MSLQTARLIPPQPCPPSSPDIYDNPNAHPHFKSLSNLLSDIAAAAAAKSSIPFQASALSALENALEGVLEKVFVAAYAVAKENGRKTIEAKDIQQVHKAILKHSKAK